MRFAICIVVGSAIVAGVGHVWPTFDAGYLSGVIMGVVLVPALLKQGLAG